MGKGEGDKVKFSGKNGKYGVRDRPPGELETAVLTGILESRTFVRIHNSNQHMLNVYSHVWC